MNGWRFACSVALVGFMIAAIPEPGRSQGVILPGAGPVNRAMAGASTAAPVDPGGAYWNPAIISGLEGSQMLFGAELLIPSTHLEASIPAGAINGLLPTNRRFGKSRSDGGVSAAPSVYLTYRPEDSKTTYGMGLAALVGGAVNFPGSATTPLLTPNNPPETFGFGPIYGEATALVIKPMISRQVTDWLAVAGGPLILQQTVKLNPAFFAPESVPGSVLPAFPSGTNSRPFWGGGFQFGLLANVTEHWKTGFSIKSPIWTERWGYNASLLDGTARRISLKPDYPMILSWGLSYTGLSKTLIAVDFRYFDYANAGLFGDVPSADGLGLGWDSVFAVATGLKYDLTDRLSLLGGYLYNENPIPDAATLFNVQLPGILQHSLSFGALFEMNETISLSFSWVHAFRNSISGPIAQVPGSSITLDTQVDSILSGIIVNY